MLRMLQQLGAVLLFLHLEHVEVVPRLPQAGGEPSPLHGDLHVPGAQHLVAAEGDVGRLQVGRDVRLVQLQADYVSLGNNSLTMLKW